MHDLFAPVPDTDGSAELAQLIKILCEEMAEAL
jgi:hypothetical protein